MPVATIGVDNDRANGVIVLTPLGRLDSGQIEKLEQVIKARLAEGCDALVIDFATTVFIASSGLRTLLLTHRAILASHGTLALCGMSANLYSVFKVSGFDRVFKIFPGRDQAIEFARPAGHVSPEPETDPPAPPVEVEEPAPVGGAVAIQGSRRVIGGVRRAQAAPHAAGAGTGPSPPGVSSPLGPVC